MTISPAPNDALAIPILFDDRSRTLSDADCTYDKFVYFSPAQARSSFNITVVDDDLAEGDEYAEFAFDTSGLSEVQPGGLDLFGLVVTAGYVVSFDIASQTVVEGDRTVDVVVSIDPVPVHGFRDTVKLTVLVSDASTAALVADYRLPSPSTVAFHGDSGSTVFVVTIVDDTESESTEFLELYFSDIPHNIQVSPGISARHVLRLADDDTLPDPSIGPADPPEYDVFFAPASLTVDEGVGTVHVAVSISPPPNSATVVPITVDRRASSAVLGSDYTLPTSSVTFDTTTTEVLFAVTILDDGLFEIDETIVLSFGSVGIDLNVRAPDKSIITIVNSDPIEHVVSFDTTSQVAAEDVGTVNVAVSIDPVPNKDLAIPITYTSRTLSDADYTYEEFVYFSSGQEGSSFAVTIVDDVEVEDFEYVAFTFDTSALPVDVVVGSRNQHVLTVTNNDMRLPPPPPPESYVVSFATTSQTVGEGDFSVDVAVSISPMLAASDAPITIPILVSDVSTAILAEDYTLPSPSVTFNGGDGSTIFVVTIVADIVPESTEFVEFLFGDLPPNVHVPSSISARHVLRLADDDTPPGPPGPLGPIEYEIFFAPASLTVDEGVGTVHVAVSISPAPGAVDAPITVPIVVDSSASSAELGSDYTLSTSEVMFDETTTEVLFAVMITDDEHVRNG